MLNIKKSLSKLFRAIKLTGKIKEILDSTHAWCIYKKIATKLNVDQIVNKNISSHSMEERTAWLDVIRDSHALNNK